MDDESVDFVDAGLGETESEEPETPPEPGPTGPDSGEEPADTEAKPKPESKPDKPEEEPDEPAKASDDSVVELDDGTTKTVGDLKKGQLMQADYTRKTQELSRAKQAIEADQQAITGEREQMKGYLKSLYNDPQFLRDELELRAPETIRTVIRTMAEEMAQEADLPDGERQARAELREYQRKERLRKMQDQADSKRAQSEQAKAAHAELVRNYAQWIPRSMKAAGLFDENDREFNAEMMGYVQARLLKAVGNTGYTEEQIASAAKEVADTPAIKTYLKQRSGSEMDPEDLEAFLGPDQMKKFRKHISKKAKQGARKPVTPAKPKPAEAKPGKKEGYSPAEVFGDLHQ